MFEKYFMLKTHKLFAKMLRESLKLEFNKVPPAAQFANEFNLRAYGSDTISRETARKWLLGLALPRPEKMIVLVKWLNLNLQDIYSHTSKDIGCIEDISIDEITKTCLEMSEDSKATILSYAKFLKHTEDSKK